MSISASATIVESSSRWIKGRFSAELESYDAQPNRLHVTGTFVVNRKRANQSFD